MQSGSNAASSSCYSLPLPEFEVLCCATYGMFQLLHFHLAVLHVLSHFLAASNPHKPQTFAKHHSLGFSWSYFSWGMLIPQMPQIGHDLAHDHMNVSSQAIHQGHAPPQSHPF